MKQLSEYPKPVGLIEAKEPPIYNKMDPEYAKKQGLDYFNLEPNERIQWLANQLKIPANLLNLSGLSNYEELIIHAEMEMKIFENKLRFFRGEI